MNCRGNRGGRRLVPQPMYPKTFARRHLFLGYGGVDAFRASARAQAHCGTMNLRTSAIRGKEAPACWHSVCAACEEKRKVFYGEGTPIEGEETQKNIFHRRLRRLRRAVARPAECRMDRSLCD